MGRRHRQRAAAVDLAAEALELARRQAQPEPFVEPGRIVRDKTVAVVDGVGIGISMRITGTSGGGAPGPSPIYARPARPGATAMVATLDELNQWHGATAPLVNGAFLRAVERDPSVTWGRVVCSEFPAVESDA